MTTLDKYIRVVGVDAGIAHFGWGIVDVFRGRERFVACGCVKTTKSDKMRKVAVADDNMRRGRIIATAFGAAIEEYKPTHLTLEAQSMPRSSSAAAKTAITFGIVLDRCVVHKFGLSTATPQEIKVAMTGKKGASKLEVQEALFARPGYGRIEDVLGGMAASKELPRGKWEHPVDAVCSVIATLESEVMIALRSTL